METRSGKRCGAAVICALVNRHDGAQLCWHLALVSRLNNDIGKVNYSSYGAAKNSLSKDGNICKSMKQLVWDCFIAKLHGSSFFKEHYLSNSLLHCKHDTFFVCLLKFSTDSSGEIWIGWVPVLQSNVQCITTWSKWNNSAFLQ